MDPGRPGPIPALLKFGPKPFNFQYFIIQNGLLRTSSFLFSKGLADVNHPREFRGATRGGGLRRMSCIPFFHYFIIYLFYSMLCFLFSCSLFLFFLLQFVFYSWSYKDTFDHISTSMRKDYSHIELIWIYLNVGMYSMISQRTEHRLYSIVHLKLFFDCSAEFGLGWADVADNIYTFPKNCLILWSLI